MKKLFVFSLLFVVFVGFSSCDGKKDKKSDACDITAFSAGGKSWSVDQTARTITVNFDKGTAVNALSVSIITSEKAIVDPASGSTVDFTTSKKFTVTAEDNKTKKEYTATATVSQQ